VLLLIAQNGCSKLSTGYSSVIFNIPTHIVLVSCTYKKKKMVLLVFPKLKGKSFELHVSNPNEVRSISLQEKCLKCFIKKKKIRLKQQLFTNLKLIQYTLSSYRVHALTNLYQLSFFKFQVI